MVNEGKQVKIGESIRSWMWWPDDKATWSTLILLLRITSGKSVEVIQVIKNNNTYLHLPLSWIRLVQDRDRRHYKRNRKYASVPYDFIKEIVGTYLLCYRALRILWQPHEDQRRRHLAQTQKYENLENRDWFYRNNTKTLSKESLIFLVWKRTVVDCWLLLTVDSYCLLSNREGEYD